MNQQADEEHQAFNDNDEIRDLRNNYQRARRDDYHQKEQQPNKERDQAQLILILSMVIYGIILISFVALLYYYSPFRYYCFDVLQTLNGKGKQFEGNDITIGFFGPFLIGLVGYIFVLTGFNVVLYDIMAGFLIKPFWYALTIVSIAKFLSKYTGFLLGRYKLRSFIYKALSENIYFITCYLACERKPVKVMFLIQFLAIPTIFKTYACGLFKITQWNYSYPTMVGTVVWASFWVYIGNKLESIFDVLQNNDTSGYIPNWLKIMMGTIVIIVLIYLFLLTKNIYKEIELDADVESISQRISRQDQQLNSSNIKINVNFKDKVIEQDDDDTGF